MGAADEVSDVASDVESLHEASAFGLVNFTITVVLTRFHVFFQSSVHFLLRVNE